MLRAAVVPLRVRRETAELGACPPRRAMAALVAVVLAAAVRVPAGMSEVRPLRPPERLVGTTLPELAVARRIQQEP